ncbi:MAG: hypothetical protein DBX55_07205 [Verrucomicrobia bacterium]|nr:MAG: hypothetical protein DBX55_07205 [Verrucomicrobiota bacterium]
MPSFLVFAISGFNSIVRAAFAWKHSFEKTAALKKVTRTTFLDAHSLSRNGPHAPNNAEQMCGIIFILGVPRAKISQNKCESA